MRLGKDDLYILEWYRIDGQLINLSKVKHIYFDRSDNTIRFDDIIARTVDSDEFDYYKRELIQILTGEQWTVDDDEWEG